MRGLLVSLVLISTLPEGASAAPPDAVKSAEAIKALRAMDDRELRDIGITRSHIEEAVWGKFDPEFGRMRF